jgi:CheY-like chemotaxis protein
MEPERHILYVEDNEDNTILLKFMLEEAEYEVTIYTTGEECLSNLSKNNFSAIILDKSLPDQDGLEICREIRKADTRIPIVLFTGDARGETSEEARRAGADACLVKPNDLENVIPTINLLIAQS